MIITLQDCNHFIPPNMHRHSVKQLHHRLPLVGDPDRPLVGRHMFFRPIDAERLADGCHEVRGADETVFDHGAGLARVGNCDACSDAAAAQHGGPGGGIVAELLRQLTPWLLANSASLALWGIDAGAQAFYTKCGFIGLEKDVFHPYLPMKTVQLIFGNPC
jgi:hypothetical protein